MAISKYFLGCPIWGNKDWVGELFSKDAKSRDFLRQYASVFNTVEGNTTFYGLPSDATINRWNSDTPDEFRFAFKFPRSISHLKRLENAVEETQRFLDVLARLQHRVGPSFLQLPPSFSPNELPALDDFLSELPGDVSLSVEVRHHGFFDVAEEEFDSLLSSHKVDRVIFDTRALHDANTGDPAEREAQRKKPRTPVRFTATGSRPFIRFVGHPVVEENLPLLAEWASVVSEWIAEGKTPYVFMHAPDDFFAPRLARHFHRLLSEHVDVGDLPIWPAEKEPAEPNQMSLF